MATLELQNLRKQFAPNVIPVKDISITVHDGEFLTLLGPSGCGKSTLLRLIAGLEQATKGQILVGGNPVTSFSPGDRNMAMVFQSYALYPHMTVAENIAASLKIRKTPTPEIQTRVATVAEKLGLSHLRDRKPGQLSGGQRQRVALARALVRNPEVFLLDEPLSNLDALLREQVREELKQIFSEQNKPVVYVTHDQTEAMTLSSKVAVLLDGLVQQLDPPARIYTHPANKFVAGFVGSPQMNLWSLNCEAGAAICGDYRIPLPALSEPPSAIDLGIRPEDVRLVNEGETPTVEGKVVLTENFGREQLVSVQIAGSSEKVRALIPPEQSWDAEKVGLVFEVQKQHWFDAQTGARLVAE
ncbi:MAG: ABC transporter ATP-binding protein [Spirulina sp. SIO3F2]|nr:ABC transporter ATP-binding protein [Spirulina sp. SIO3F2]